MGFASGAKRQGSRLSMSPGSLLIMASDGLVSGRDDSWLRAQLQNRGDTDERALARTLLTEAGRHGAGGDDMTVICVACEDRQ